MDEENRKGFDARWRSVLLFSGTVEGGQADVDVAECVHARVRGPHPGERLPHNSYGILHCRRAEGATTGLEGALFVTLCKELEKRYLVDADTGEKGVDSQSDAKGLPEAPYGMRGAAALRRSAGTHRCLNRAPVSAELMKGVRRCSCQDVVCGYRELK